MIRNGGAVFSNGGTVGSGSSSSNNNVVITGLGSVWSNGADLLVGNSSGGNSLVISNGGQVIDGYGYAGGYFGGSNSVVVTGSGSVWSNRNDLYVGNFGLEQQPDHQRQWSRLQQEHLCGLQFPQQ